MSIRAKPREGVTFSLSSTDGFAGTQPWVVEGLTGRDVLEKMYRALLAPELPAIGTPYPEYAANTIVKDLRASPQPNPTKATVTVVFGKPEADSTQPSETDPGSFFVGMSLQEFETAYDINGNQIITSRLVTDLNGNTEPEDLTGTVSALFPIMVLGTTRLEPRTPADKARLYTPKLNSTRFAGENRGRWLCVRLEGSSDDNGDTYNVTYEFHRSPLFKYGTAPNQVYSGWDVLIVHQKDGRPIKNPVLGESQKIIRLYEEIDFNRLNLGL